MPTNLVVIPYHDWRKISQEGGRTRDAHLTEQCIAHPDIGCVLIINRPMTLPEMIYKQRSWKTPGQTLWQKDRARLVKIHDNAFVLDYFDRSLIGPIWDGKQSFLKAYGQPRFVQEIMACLQRLQMEDAACISFNLFAADLVATLPARPKLFDAWDNFMRFPEHSPIRVKLMQAYQTYARVADCWTTNSRSNRSFYTSTFGVQHCLVIPNGVDPDKFSTQYELPSDIDGIPRPIVGFGGKVTHLLDYALLNYLTEANPEVSLVMVGQILEKDIFRQIRKRSNLFYLGDKPYESYSAYVAAFDVCIIPYVVGEREHGGDSIKFYEYLAAGKPVVTTRIEGVSEEFGNTLIADSHSQFSEMIRLALKTSAVRIQLPERITWKFKGNELVRLLQRPPG